MTYRCCTARGLQGYGVSRQLRRRTTRAAGGPLRGPGAGAAWRCHSRAHGSGCCSSVCANCEKKHLQALGMGRAVVGAGELGRRRHWLACLLCAPSVRAHDTRTCAPSSCPLGVCVSVCVSRVHACVHAFACVGVRAAPRRREVHSVAGSHLCVWRSDLSRPCVSPLRVLCESLIITA